MYTKPLKQNQTYSYENVRNQHILTWIAQTILTNLNIFK